jgi:chromosome segregation ATPase
MPVQAKETISDTKILRVIDVNLNRLREALRVIEEHYRFLRTDKDRAASFKSLRHSLEDIEAGIGREKLLASRDIASDPFANENRPEELVRATAADVLRANFKRGQEASRVLEEYAKVSPAPGLSQTAKTVRFSLYTLEKDISE